MKYDSTITLGNIIATLSFLIPAVVYGVGFVQRFNVAEKDIAEIKYIQRDLSKNIIMLSENQRVVSALLNHHFKIDIEPGKK